MSRHTLRESCRMLTAAADDYYAACEGEEETTPLQWLSAFLSEARQMGPHPDEGDTAPWWEALVHCEVLLHALKDAHEKAGGRA